MNLEANLSHIQYLENQALEGKVWSQKDLSSKWGLSEHRNSLRLELWGEVHESPVRVHHGTSGSLSLGLALGQALSSPLLASLPHLQAAGVRRQSFRLEAHQGHRNSCGSQSS